MSISKNEIKRIRALSQKKFRDESGLFICEGEKLVSEALASSFQVEAVYRLEDIGEEAMSRISALSSPSPALAVVRMPENRDRLSPEAAAAWLVSSGTGKDSVFLGLDGIKDPGNAGTIIRLSDWFGIDGIFASEGTVDIYNPKVVQATMGAVFRTRFIYTRLDRLCEILQHERIPVYGTFLEGENIYKTPLPRGKAKMIVMGSESNGISAETAARIDRKLYIPSFGNSGSESLNVAVAAAVICSEFRR